MPCPPAVRIAMAKAAPLVLGPRHRHPTHRDFTCRIGPDGRPYGLASNNTEAKKRDAELSADFVLLEKE